MFKVHQHPTLSAVKTVDTLNDPGLTMQMGLVSKSQLVILILSIRKLDPPCRGIP